MHDRREPPVPTVRLRLVIAYDGTAYQGWQTQKVGTGVQSLVENALRHLFPGCGPLHGSSRTDTGVHALGLVAHLDIPRAEWRMTAAKLVLAVNAHLPEDVRVLRVSRASSTFHARFDARLKEYRYRIWNAPAANPLLRQFAWHVPRPLHLPAMREAAGHFVGTHDFASFTTNPGYARASTTRTLTLCRVLRHGSELVIRIRGDGFLYRMCRGIAGTLVQVGQGRIPPEAIPELLEKRSRTAGGVTAPPHGLTLWQVFYGPRTGQPPGPPPIHDSSSDA